MTREGVTLDEAARKLGITRQRCGQLARQHGAVVRARRPQLVDLQRIEAARGLSAGTIARRLRDVAQRDLAEQATRRDAAVLLLAFAKLCPDAKPLPEDARLLRVMAGLE